MSKKQLVPAKNYEVGYGRPPKEKQFIKGKSGNPLGRPKGAKTKRSKGHEEKLKNIIYDEAYRDVPVQGEYGMVAIPMAQAVARSVAVKAAKGDHRSQKLFFEALSAAEKADLKIHREYQETWGIYKIEWEKELERRERLGITAPDPLPHPDNISIDWKTGDLIVWGPVTREEKKQFDVMVILEEKKIGLHDELAETNDPDRPEEIYEQIAILDEAIEELKANWRK